MAASYPDPTGIQFQHNLPTAIVGQSLLCYTQVGSTNDLIKEHARAGHAEGLVVFAEEQTGGRGRQGHRWRAPWGSSLLFSLLLRPFWMSPTDTFMLTMMAGVALCEAIEQSVPVRASLKWPNDLMLAPCMLEQPGLRKAGGVLSELMIENDRVVWAVLGIGINVNWVPVGIVDGRDLAQVATSISAVLGCSIDRSALLQNLLIRLDERYLSLRAGQREELFERWRDRLALLGQQVCVQLPGSEINGLAEKVEPSGALCVRDKQGVLHTVLAGDLESA